MTLAQKQSTVSLLVVRASGASDLRPCADFWAHRKHIGEFRGASVPTPQGLRVAGYRQFVVALTFGWGTPAGWLAHARASNSTTDLWHAGHSCSRGKCGESMIARHSPCRFSWPPAKSLVSLGESFFAMFLCCFSTEQ